MNMRLIFCMVGVLQASLLAAVLPVTQDLIIHLKADSITGLSNGAAVSTWPDSATADSVNGTVSAVAGQSLPTWHAGIVGGRPIVRFSNDILSTSQFTLPNPSGGITILALFTGDSSANAAQRLAQIGQADGTAGKVIGLDASTNETDANGGSGFRFNNGRALAKSPNPLTTGFHIAAWQMAQGAQQQTATFYVDTVVPQNLNTNNPTNTTTLPTSGNSFGVGGGVISGNWGTADYYTGDAAELLVYNRQLTALQIEAVMNYLYARYFTSLIVVSPVQITLSEGQSGTVAVSLESQPEDDVTVYLDGTDQAQADQTVLTFTPGDWDQPQSVQVTAVDDILLETESHGAAITLTAVSDDPVYDGAVASITVNVLDNECGRWAYLPGDFNEDCTVDLKDLAVLASHWLWCDPMNNDLCTNLQ